MPLLEIEDLHVSFKTIDGVVHAVEGVSLSLGARKTLGVVGESGSGKSVTAQTILGLTRFPNATITGRIVFAPALHLPENDGDPNAPPTPLAAVPAAGREIRAWYRRGGGSAGNIPAGTISIASWSRK